MIEIDNLHKAYRGADGRPVEVLKGISLTVPAASITAVVGPSGAGKSTLAKCISLLEHPDAGSIRVNGQDLSRLSGAALKRERRAIGTVFQSSALLSRKTAWENVALPLQWLGVVPGEIRRHVGELLDSVGLADKAHHYPAQLSGGQRQRVGIARALALKPSVLLADEATSGLDPQATDAILQLLKNLRAQFGLAIVLITHEMDVVRSTADAVAEIRDGRLQQQGPLGQLLGTAGSPLAAQLFPLRPLAADDALQLRLTCAPHASSDWISRLTLRHNLQVEVLAAHVEAVRGVPAGRLQVAVRFNQRPLTPETLCAELAQLGLLAEIVALPAQLQEAG